MQGGSDSSLLCDTSRAVKVSRHAGSGRRVRLCAERERTDKISEVFLCVQF